MLFYLKKGILDLQNILKIRFFFTQIAPHVLEISANTHPDIVRKIYFFKNSEFSCQMF